MTEKLLQWYDLSARRLPWRENQDPYRVWLSEIMLQQTRVDTVIDYFQRWLQVFPSIEALASASEDQVLKQWQGLGYYHRARNFYKAARTIVEKDQGEFPVTAETWRKLPGIGEYTAAAIASIVYHQVIPVFDGNVIRVMTRLLGITEDPTNKKIKERLLQQSMLWISYGRPGDYNQAMMELGATICLPNTKPGCEICPISSCCCISGTDQWQEIPRRKEALKRRVEERTVFVLRNQQKFLIQKRSETGLLANLWELPNLEGYLSQEEIFTWLRQQKYNQVSIQPIEKVFKHIFSHLEWHMKTWIIDINACEELKEANWVNPASLQTNFAIPTAFMGILEFVAKLSV